MLKVNYPAVYHLENKKYWVEFPDLEGCFSDGKTLDEAYANSKEALSIYLNQEGDLYKRIINKPSSLSKIMNQYKDDFVMMVECDSLDYAKKYNNKSVKKTLSIPGWLNDLAIKNNINFSNVLQDALLAKLYK